MISRTRIALLVALHLDPLPCSLLPSFTHKLAKVSGKLSVRGYTVIALAASGKAKTDRAARGKFKLRPPTKKVTLQLRAPDGTYAGPMVVAKAKHGTEAIVGIRAGAKLGKVEVKPDEGYANSQSGSPASTSTSSARPSPNREPRSAPATSAWCPRPRAAMRPETVTSTKSRTRSTSMTTATSSSTGSTPSPRRSPGLPPPVPPRMQTTSLSARSPC